MRQILQLCLIGLVSLSNCTRVNRIEHSKGKLVVIAQSNEHLAFPSIARLNTGELVCAFRRGKGHVSPDGNILLCRSADNGVTWSRPDTIISTPLDCRDASLVQLADGSLLFSFFQSRYDATGKIIGAVGVFTSQSTDGGRTWTAPQQIIINEYDWAAVSSKTLELPDGALLMPLYAGKAGSKKAALVAMSRDHGRTFNERYIVAFEANGNLDYQEPALLQLSDGRVLCVLRTAGQGNFQYQSYSADGGKTWSKPERTSMQGQAAGLFLTKDNILVCAYRDFSPNGTSYALSYDLGLTYEHEHVIHAFGGDRAYPEIVPLSDGQLLCCYYEAEKGGSRICGYIFQISRPETPKGLEATVTNDGSVSLRWNAVPGVHYYKILREASDNAAGFARQDFAGKQIASSAENSFVDGNLQSGHAYRYQVAAIISSSELIKDSGAVSLPAQSRVLQVKGKAQAGQ